MKVQILNLETKIMVRRDDDLKLLLAKVNDVKVVSFEKIVILIYAQSKGDFIYKNTLISKILNAIAFSKIHMSSNPIRRKK